MLIILPDTCAASRIRQVLVTEANKLNIPALLGPHITTLKKWVTNQNSRFDAQTISHYCRELILYDALSQHPQLYGKGNPWTLTNELLQLFDELTLGNARLPADINEFVHRLSQAYGIKNDGIHALGREAKLVHTLWHAWHKQLESKNFIDETTDYVLCLTNSTNNINPVSNISSNISSNINSSNVSNNNCSNKIYLLGFYDLSAIESDWIKSNQVERQRHLILYGEDNPVLRDHTDLRDTTSITTTTPYTEGINAVFNNEGSVLKNRALAFSKQYPQSPFKERLSVFTANNSEDEAIAIDLQVRSWLLEGKNNIGIVTENRRLARRVRALLERANIAITDYSGWALSTSSAASVIERWLQVIEEDFAHEPLLDILKSSFVFSEWDNEERLHTVYRLENDIILHENIPRGLHRYRQHGQFRKNRLPEQFHESYAKVFLLLDQLEQAAAPLQALISGKLNSNNLSSGNLISENKYPATHLLSTLIESLELLGVYKAFAQDSAGERILQELEQMQFAASTNDIELDWLGFRTWLGRTLEQNNFQPSIKNSPVLLMGVVQSNLHFFDGLIVGAVEQEFLPGAASHSPFFNDGVRMELGLDPSTKNQSVFQYHFRRLLDSSPSILLTHRRQQESEDVIASPWLELIQAFHSLAYDEKLTNPVLEKLVHHSDAHVLLCDSLHRAKELPGPADQPKVVILPQLIPNSVSASSHQQLINCPYQYFAQQCLKLAPPDEIREALQKSDYGSRVHRCLEAFHGDVAGLPGPISKNVEPSMRLEAIELLEEISNAVFANDLEDNFQHRGWLKKWLGIIPAYVDWQIEHAQNWQVRHVELQQTYEDYSRGISLKGRLDRIDDSQQGLGVIDYKTGTPPHQDDIDSGEAVQLPFYALLADILTVENPQYTTARVEYVYLDNNQATNKASLESEHLIKIKEQTAERLKLLMNSLSQGTPAPAWGDELTCSRCTMEGLCRKSVWENQVENNSGQSNNKAINNKNE
ncbi:MAG: DNA helicase [Gammaproteobacteria bacterium]|nr:DNA helicase [Gammaproteobacteria bacterium]